MQSGMNVASARPSLATPGLPEDIVHLRDWHFFRHFLHDANPPYMQEEMDRYVEAWSQPGAAAGMIKLLPRLGQTVAEGGRRKASPAIGITLVIWGEPYLFGPR
jgi:epoxide hydrolase 4